MTLLEEVRGVRLQINEAAADAAITELVGLPDEKQKALTDALIEARDDAAMRADLMDIAFQIAAAVAKKGLGIIA